jgi:hypothetical protein
VQVQNGKTLTADGPFVEAEKADRRLRLIVGAACCN